MSTRQPFQRHPNPGSASIENARRSDRVHASLSIEVIGTDYQRGQPFSQKGRTVTLSKHGASIALHYPLAADQELTIRCVDTGKEAGARVVGLIKSAGENLLYGVGFLDAEANPWGIEFPIAESEAFGRTLLTCRWCQTSKVFHLNEIELQVFVANGSIQQFCQACSATTSWKRAETEAVSRPHSANRAKAQEPPQERRAERRKHRRVGSNAPACIRHLGSLEEVVACDISRSGVCLRSSKPYREGALIEVALPYSPEGSGNIFVPARVTRAQSFGHYFKLGVAYSGASERQRVSVYGSGSRSVSKIPED
jgi:hypothetical protein